MQCDEARKIIYLTPEVEPITRELVEAKEHIRHCHECEGFFREEETLKNLIRERAPREKAPPHVRENILAEIAKRSKQSLSNSVYNISWSVRNTRAISFGLMGIFLILLTVLLFYSSLFKQEYKSLASQLAEDHIRNIPEAAQILSSEPGSVENWFWGKVDFAVKVPELRGATLVGGRLCHIKNNRVALLFYEKDKRPISLFVMGSSLEDLSSIGRSEIQDKSLHYQSNKGCNLIFWREKGILYGLVSDIKREELVRLVSETNLKD